METRGKRLYALLAAIGLAAAMTFVLLSEKSIEGQGRFDATATISRVVDGDTVEITPAVDGIEDVRLIGVDTPETRDSECGKQPYADEASAFTTRELEDQEVELEFDEERADQYGHLLAYVYPRVRRCSTKRSLEKATHRLPLSHRTLATRTVSGQRRRRRDRRDEGFGASPTMSSPRRQTAATVSEEASASQRKLSPMKPSPTHLPNQVPALYRALLLHPPRIRDPHQNQGLHRPHRIRARCSRPEVP